MAMLSQRAYALHRRGLGLTGGTLSAVQKAVASGRIHLINGQIDAASADESWEQNSDHSQRRDVGILQAASPGKRATTKKATTPKDKKATTSGATTSHAPAAPAQNQYTKARTVTETFKARTAQLEYEALVGKYVLASEIEREWGQMVSAARTKVLGIASKLRSRAAHLAPEDFELIEALCREALEDLANGSN